MQCPKCKHVQRNTIECEACGVIFAKYKKFQEKKRAEQEQRELAQSSGKSWIMYVVIAVLAGAAAGGTYFFLGSTGKEIAVTDSVKPASVNTEMISEPVASVERPRPRPAPVENFGPPANPIDHARRATVMIKTPWGTGSGFFVNKHYIVTNRHVVEFDESKLVEFRDKVDKARQLIELEKQKLKDLRGRMTRMPKGPSRSQLAIIIETREEELQKVIPQYEEGQRRLDNLDRNVQPSDIKIVFSDGTEYEANYLLFSDNHDLALMSLYSGEWDYIRRAPEHMRMQRGDKVYAIGSPLGLAQTVTSGIISGTRRDPRTGEDYIQTDAAINPGNSGGPLIDEHGYVRGVNTMIFRATEGIAFSIPIEVVFEEFNSALF